MFYTVKQEIMLGVTAPLNPQVREGLRSLQPSPGALPPGPECFCIESHGVQTECRQTKCRQTICRQTKCRTDKMSIRQNVEQTKCRQTKSRTDKMSTRQIFFFSFFFFQLKKKKICFVFL